MRDQWERREAAQKALRRVGKRVLRKARCHELARCLVVLDDMTVGLAPVSDGLTAREARRWRGISDHFRKRIEQCACASGVRANDEIGGTNWA